MNRLVILHYLLQVAVAITCASCENHIAPAAPYPDALFNSLEWKKDSTGCSTYRERVYESVAKNEAYFLGKDYKFLVDFLGKPSVPYLGRGKHRLYYVVDCTAIPILKSEQSSTGPLTQKVTYSPDYATTLVFDMRRDTCINLRISVP